MSKVTLTDSDAVYDYTRDKLNHILKQASPGLEGKTIACMGYLCFHLNKIM